MKVPEHLKEFQFDSEEELRNTIDPELRDWRREPATQKQIAKVYAILGNMGYDNFEKEMFEAETNFHHMTKSEISDLIDELEGGEKKEKKEDEDFYPFF